MQKIVFIMLLLFVTAGIAQAEVLKSGSLYCVSLKKMIDYEKYKEQNREDFIERIFAKSECFIKKKDEEVFVRSESKEYVEVELLSGFSVWTRKENINR